MFNIQKIRTLTTALQASEIKAQQCEQVFKAITALSQGALKPASVIITGQQSLGKINLSIFKNCFCTFGQ